MFWIEGDLEDFGIELVPADFSEADFFVGWTHPDAQAGDKSLCTSCPDAFPYMLKDYDRAAEMGLPSGEYAGYDYWPACQEICEPG